MDCSIPPLPPPFEGYRRSRRRHRRRLSIPFQGNQLRPVGLPRSRRRWREVFIFSVLEATAAAAHNLWSGW